MARIRTIKPEFFTSEDIVELEPLARLLYIALWCEADKEGRFSWKPKTFKMRYFPGDDCNIDALCDALVTRGLVCLYGDSFAYVPSFKDHQHINPREKDSVIPGPDEYIDARVSDASVTVKARAGRKEGREGKEKVVASKRETPISDDFAISETVRSWAEANGHSDLDAAHFHLDQIWLVQKCVLQCACRLLSNYFDLFDSNCLSVRYLTLQFLKQ